MRMKFYHFIASYNCISHQTVVPASNNMAGYAITHAHIHTHRERGRERDSIKRKMEIEGHKVDNNAPHP